jgi:1,4-alpha-glucan branching enzyme
LVADLNALYVGDAALAENETRPESFNWLVADDGAQSVLAFERRGRDCAWVVAGNFTPVERTYRLGVPSLGKWEEAVNTDSKHYAGKGLGNLGGVQAEAIPCQGRPYSIEVRLPGLSLLIFRQSASGKPVKAKR